MTAYPNLDRLPRLLAAQRRRRALVSGLRAFLALFAVHLALLAALASHPCISPSLRDGSPPWVGLF